MLMSCKSVRITVLIFVGLIIGLPILSAQSNTLCLIDYDTRQPIEFATLQCSIIKNSGNTKINFSLSDVQGRIEFCHCDDRDSVKWKVRHLSYFPIDTIISCNLTPDTILMHSKNYGIDEIIVSGKDEGVRVIGDTIRFDLKVFRKPHQRDLKDLLNDLPDIYVSKKGIVEYRGKPVGQILLRGKSAARNQFDMFNRVIKNDDLETIQLTPNDSNANEFNQVMNLDLVLKPDKSLFGQIQSRLSNQTEIEGSASLIRSGNTRWNHSFEVAFSQIADAQRPNLNLFREVFDDSYKYKKALNIKQHKLNTFGMLDSDLSAKDEVAHVFYNALFEGDNSKLNFYLRHRNHTSFKLLEQIYFNVNTLDTLWKEKTNTDTKQSGSLFLMSWQYNMKKKLTLRATSHIAQDNYVINRNGHLFLPNITSTLNRQDINRNFTNATMFVHALWQIDSSWILQIGTQLGANEKQNMYDFVSDSMIYDIVLNSNSRYESFQYRLNRKKQNFDIGTSLQCKGKNLDQKTTWVINYNATSMRDHGGLENVVSGGSAFFSAQKVLLNTLTSLFNHEIKFSKISFTNKVGGTFFQSNQLFKINQPYRWSAQSRFNYTLSRNQSIFWGYKSEVNWVDDSYLWKTAIPKNLQSYSVNSIPNPVIMRSSKCYIGWKEFSILDGNFSKAKVEYQYQPIHYERRQKINRNFNVDTLVSERDFTDFNFEFRTTRKIQGVRFSLGLNHHQSYSYGIDLLASQKIKKSDFTFRLGARDILQSKVLFLAFRTSFNRQIWQFENQSLLPPQWNSESSIQTRLYIKKLNFWFATDVTYLWRGSIYNETLLNGQLEKKIGKHFMCTLGVYNLFNLDSNERRNRFILADSYQESEQIVFGGRIYLKLKYQL